MLMCFYPNVKNPSLRNCPRAASMYILGEGRGRTAMFVQLNAPAIELTSCGHCSPHDGAERKVGAERRDRAGTPLNQTMAQRRPHWMAASMPMTLAGMATMATIKLTAMGHCVILLHIGGRILTNTHEFDYR
jgi:hypothetical protein